MNTLTVNETALLMSVLKLQGNAYGVTLKERLSQITDKEWNYGTLYCMLDQLAKKGFLAKTTGEPTHERGGRRKIYYSVTSDGNAALHSAYRLNMNLWEGYSELTFD